MARMKLAAIGLAALLAAAPAHAQNLGLGQRLFHAHCASCHGEDAQGKGWLSEYLTRRPANLTLIAKKNGGAFPTDEVRAMVDGRHDVATHGPRDMPVWGERYEYTLGGGSDPKGGAALRIDSLVEYLRTLQK